MALKASLIEFLISQVRNSVTDLAAGTVTFYEAGTTTPKNVYTAPDKLTTVANPLTLDSNATYQVYGDGNYKIVIKDSTGTTVYTRDNYYAGLDTTSIDWTTVVTAPTVPGKNYVINGNFDAWSFATSQTSSGEGSDNQWYNFHNGSSKTASRQTFTLGQTDVPGEPLYFSRTAVTTSAGAGNYAYKQARIPKVQTLAGQQVTLSFYAKADASKNIAVEFVQSFGTGGSPSADVTNIGTTTKALTTSWVKYTVTATLSSVSGKTLGSGGDDYLGVNFWLDAGSTYNGRTNTLGQQSITFDLARVKLETGASATDFIPDNHDITLAETFSTKVTETGGTERMRVNSSGNVEIGRTDALSAKLSLKATAGTYGAYFQTTGDTNTLWATGSSNATWTGVFYNGGGNGLGVLIDCGTALTSTAIPLQVRDVSGATTYLQVNGSGAVQLPTTYNNTSASAANVYIDSNGKLWRSTSSLKYKTDVQDAVHGLTDLLKLRSVTYKGKTDGEKVFGGLIAEEVHAAGLTEFVQYADDGSPDALAYGNMVALLVKAVQELTARLEALEGK